MGYEKVSVKGKNDKETINGSQNIIVEVIRAMSDVVNKNRAITEFKLTMMTKDISEDDVRTFEGDRVFIEKDTMKCLDISCKNAGQLNNFLTFLEYTYDLHINMTKEICRNFRTKFTSLYYDAFFGEHVTYTMDIDEINKIFEARQFKYQIISVKPAGTSDILYRLIDTTINEGDEVYRFLTVEDNPDNSNNLKTELRNFILMFKNTYRIMDSGTYKIFATGFKNIYNSYVDDKYEKITITQINNILKSMRMEYEVKRKMQEWFIQKI